MKITEKDGKQVVEFEGKDDELRINFLKEMEKMDVMITEVRDLARQHDDICTRLRIAKKRLELYKLENHEAIWGPLNEQVRKDLGVDEAPGMAFDKEDGLTVVGKEDEGHPLLDILRLR